MKKLALVSTPSYIFSRSKSGTESHINLIYRQEQKNVFNIWEVIITHRPIVVVGQYEKSGAYRAA